MSQTASEVLMSRIQSKEAHVAVLGLGYVGLPLALLFAEKGFRVLGFDTDAEKVRLLHEGDSYIEHIPAERVAQARRSGGLEATDDFSRLVEADAVLICVPTPVGDHQEPDLSFVEATTEEIASHMRSGCLVCLISTSYPGTTREVVMPILNRSGLRVGEDYFLVFSPEREDPGNPRYSTRNIPKIVGGLTPTCKELGIALFSQVLERVIPVSSPEVAETAKILENVYRCVNIALVNELKTLLDRMGIDVWEVVDAAATKPFGFSAFYPGPGVGGHCIPIDPFYLTWKAREYGVRTRFIELAGEVNTAMPEYVVARAAQALNSKGKALNGSRVLILGVAYKRDVGDLRESAALQILELLRAAGAEVAYSDPHVPVIPRLRRHRLDLKSVEVTPQTLRSSDLVLIATDHSDFDYELVVKHAPLVVDTRNATRAVKEHRDKIVW